MSATEPASLSAAEPSYESPAADAFVDFMAAVNRGDVIEVVALLAADIPDVPGLGTVYHPSLLNDPALWEAGELDRQRVIRFVTTAAYSDVVVSSCVGFSDGPVVVVASCDYELARGFAAHLGLTEQTGKIFAFIVDGKVAGVAASAAHFQLAA